MRIAVSNLAWGFTDVAKLAPLLRDWGASGIEMAPTLQWPQAPDVSASEAAALRQALGAGGLAVSGIQSLFFGHPEMQLFDPRAHDAMRTHAVRMIELAGQLGASAAVFGAPGNRIRGDKAEGAAQDMACELLASLVGALERARVVLTLEPNPPAYGCDFMTTYAQAVALADRIGSPWIRPQIDTACLASVGEDPVVAAQGCLPAHVHISGASLGLPAPDAMHAELARALREQRYPGWVVLEMRAEGAEGLRQVREALDWIVPVYGQS